MKPAVSAILVAVSAFIQLSGFSIFGVKPNLALAAAIAASIFIPGILEPILFSGIAALILKFAPAPGMEIAVFFIVVAAAGIAGKHFPWRKPINNFVAIFLSVSAFYAIMEMKFVGSPFFWKEIFLNLIFGGAIFYFLSLYGKIGEKDYD